MAEEKQSGNRLFLKWHISDQSLRDQFKKFGNITEARVVNPRIHSFGFITFSTEAEAEHARQAMNGQRLQSGELTIEAAASEPKERKPRAPRERAPAAAPRKEKQERQEKPVVERTPNPRAGQLNGVTVIPDPVAFPAKESTELKAQPRKFRTGKRAPQDGTLTTTVNIKANSVSPDIKIGNFNVKLSSIIVKSENQDTKVRIKVSNAESARSGELYFRVREEKETVYNYKFFELRGEQEASDAGEPKPVSTNFLGIESITVDRNTGSWKNIVLSLHHAEFPRRPQKQRSEPAETQEATEAVASADSLPRQRARPSRGGNGGGNGGGRPRGRGGAGGPQE